MTLELPLPLPGHHLMAADFSENNPTNNLLMARWAHQ
jgi:hypothetical protein